LRGFERRLNEFHARGVEVVAISADSNEQSRKLGASQGYTFPFLSDTRAEVIRRYGVLHARAGEDGRDIARPAEFLVDATGTIRWVKLTDDVRVRARPEDVLRVIDELALASAR
jgi:peroxiredoxin